MKKNILALGLTCVLALSLLAGCTGNKQDDAADAPTGEYTGGPTWGKPAPKMAVNFEGRVASIEDGKVTLEDGTVVLTDDAAISAPDGNAAEITVGDYIQGYAEDSDAAERNATAILITAL